MATSGTSYYTPEYQKSPYEPSLGQTDLTDTDLSACSSPSQHCPDRMDTSPGLLGNASRSNTNNGLSGAMDEKDAVGPVSAHESPQSHIQSRKPGKSYAQLLYDCFMSIPEHRMTLQDIYKWFRENTSKAKDESGKGWQNSVRHNLSMNQVSEAKSAGPRHFPP